MIRQYSCTTVLQAARLVVHRPSLSVEPALYWSPSIGTIIAMYYVYPLLLRSLVHSIHPPMMRATVVLDASILPSHSFTSLDHMFPFVVVSGYTWFHYTRHEHHTLASKDQPCRSLEIGGHRSHYYVRRLCASLVGAERGREQIFH